MSETRNDQSGAGNPDETTAVTRVPRSGEGQVWVGVIGVMALTAVLGAMMANCGYDHDLARAHTTTRSMVDKTAADVAILQAQVGITTARTIVVEAHTNKLYGDANTDRLSADELLRRVQEVEDNKADRDELRRYARTKRMAKVERKLDDHIASVEDAVAVPTRKITIRHTPTYVDVYRSRTP